MGANAYLVWQLFLIGAAVIFLIWLMIRKSQNQRMEKRIAAEMAARAGQPMQKRKWRHSLNHNLRCRAGCKPWPNCLARAKRS